MARLATVVGVEVFNSCHCVQLGYETAEEHSCLGLFLACSSNLYRALWLHITPMKMGEEGRQQELQ